ncbi:MAG: hypothetical protein IJ112_05055 [Oscillospiraceae bacterium]|nr:hypothetical protein [Oscillospiraceae bacterium]
MKNNRFAILALAALAAVIVCAYVWCVTTGAASLIFAFVTLACGAVFVYAVNKLAAHTTTVTHLPDHTITKGQTAA